MKFGTYSKKMVKLMSDLKAVSIAEKEYIEGKTISHKMLLKKLGI